MQLIINNIPSATSAIIYYKYLVFRRIKIVTDYLYLIIDRVASNHSLPLLWRHTYKIIFSNPWLALQKHATLGIKHLLCFFLNVNAWIGILKERWPFGADIREWNPISSGSIGGWAIAVKGDFKERYLNVFVIDKRYPCDIEL